MAIHQAHALKAPEPKAAVKPGDGGEQEALRWERAKDHAAEQQAQGEAKGSANRSAAKTAGKSAAKKK